MVKSKKKPSKRGVKPRKVVKRRRLNKAVSNAVRLGAAAVSAYSGYRRSRGGARVKSKRIKDVSSYQQWESYRAKRRFGKLTQRKINHLSMESTTFFWRSLGNLDLGLGTLLFNNYYTAGSAAGVPMYIFELNSCINTRNAQVHSPSPMYIPTRTEAGGYTWNSQNGQAADGSNSTVWHIERAPDSSTSFSTFPGGASILEWADIRLDLFGCKAQPTKFIIELCQLSEDVVPSVGTNTDLNHVRFWDQQIRSFISNPNLSQIGYGFAKEKRVLDRRVVDIDPTSTTESDQDPHIKTLKLFYKLNRRCKYNWKDYIAGVSENPSNTQLPTVWIPTAIDDNNVQVHPRARMFMLIRAVKFVRNATYVAQTNTDTPSMNIQVRTRHLVGV